MLRVGRLLELYIERAQSSSSRKPAALRSPGPRDGHSGPSSFIRPTRRNCKPSDRERFSSLERLIRVFALSEIGDVDWNGYVADVSHVKLALLNHFYGAIRRWRLPAVPPLGPIAPAASHPLPPTPQIERGFFEAERAEASRETTSQSVQRWGDAGSYNKYSAWVERAEIVSALIPDGSSILEIGVGKGDFRSLVFSARTLHVGADLNPLDADTIALNLDSDPLPPGYYDYCVVLLGVLEYVRRPNADARKICDAARHLVITYCCKIDASAEGAQERLQREWINDFTEAEFVALFASLGKPLVSRASFQRAPHFEQVIFKFGPATG